MSESSPITYYISSFFRDEVQIARGLSNHTYRSYRISIQSFISFLEDTLQKGMFQITGDDLSYELVYGWMLDQCQKNNWGPSTWNSRLSAIKTFIRFLSRQNIRYLNLLSRVELIRNKKKVKNPSNYMTLLEFETILRKVDTNKLINFRDKLIFQILFFSGARVSELTGLKVQDITFLKSRCVTLNFMGKGRKSRTVIIKEKATYQNIKKYLQILIGNKLQSEYLFEGQNGSRMSEKNVRRIICKHYSCLGKKVISPHSFRHSAAMHWLESGMGIYAVSALLGHENIQTTTDYLKSTFKMKSDALDSCGQNKQLSQIFAPKFSTNDEFWDHLGVTLQPPP